MSGQKGGSRDARGSYGYCKGDNVLAGSGDPHVSENRPSRRSHHMSDLLRRSMLAAPVVGLLLGTALLTAQQPPPAPAPAPVPAAGAPAGVEELTRGPVHEAFGRPVVFDPQPGPGRPGSDRWSQKRSSAQNRLRNRCRR